jgi:hypothetical protein
MPVKLPPKERPIIEMLLSAYGDDTWKDASLDWVEETQDSAVEVIATRPDGQKLALEHTLIQPFVGERLDSEAFRRAFGCIEKNPALALPKRNLFVDVPVNAIPNGYNWEEVGRDLLTWLMANHAGAPIRGEAVHAVPVGRNSRSGPLQLRITLRAMSVPGNAGTCLIGRDGVPEDLGTVVEKALRTKIPKLVKTAADKRILLLESEHISLWDRRIYEEVTNLAPKFPDLANVDEIWFANTSGLVSDAWVTFTFWDGRGCVEWLNFENGALKTRRDDRPDLGPPTREF